ncbi:MAG: delta-60 repeat domain-containing protein [Chitinophagaceae bacterium]|nr:delta-60 repeat domain-containing protein [Oligoflexus sp.]
MRASDLYFCLFLILTLFACSPREGEEADEKSGLDGANPETFLISSEIQKPELALNALDVNHVQMSVDGCASSYHYAGIIKTLTLYRDDRNCVARLSQIRVNGVDYFAPASGSTSAGSTLVFTDTSRLQSLLVSTVSQLSSSILANDKIAFKVGYPVNSGSTTYTLTTVSIESDVSTAVEGPSSQINITVSRDQSVEPLSVALEFTGDGAERLKGMTIPTQVDFAAGQKQKILNWSVPSNNLGEVDQTFDFDLGDGPYLIGLKSNVAIELQDAAPTISLAQSFAGCRDIDLNLDVSADAETLSWETLAGPLTLTVYESNGKTYVKALADGEYDLKLTAVGVNGKKSVATPHVSLDLSPPVMDAPLLLVYLSDGWMSIADSQTLQAISSPGVGHDANSFSLSYSLIAVQDPCDATQVYTNTIPRSDDARLIAKRSYRICLKAQDSYGWQSFAVSAPFSYETFIPTVTLSGLPAAYSSLAKVVMPIGGQGVYSYRYALMASRESCTNAALYGSEVRDAQITLDLTAYDNRDVKICVIGRSEAGNWQALADATSYKWHVNLSAPDPITAIALTSLSERIKVSFTAPALANVKYLIVRSESDASQFSPVNGMTYALGASQNGATVIANGNKADVFDNRINSTLPASYTIYAYDAALNYSTPTTSTQSALARVPFNVAQGFDRALRGGVKFQKLGNTGNFYVYGDFTQFGTDLSANHITRFDSSGRRDAGFVTDIINGSIYSIAEDSQGRIYIAGAFTKVGTVVRLRVARLLSNGALDTSFVTTAGPNANVMALELDERVPGSERLYAAGSFSAFGTSKVGRLAAMTLTGALDMSYASALGAGFDNTIYSLKLLPASGTLLVGGAFTAFNGISGAGTTRISRINLASRPSPAAIDTSFAMGTGPNNSVYVLDVDASGNLYAGGAFTSVNGSSNSKYLARFSPTGVIDAAFAVAKKLNGPVWSLAFDTAGSALIAAGDFTLYGSVASNRMIRLALDASGTQDINASTAIGSGFNSIVYGLALSQSNLIAGGSFSNYNGQNMPFLVRISPGSLQPFASQPVGSMLNAQSNTAVFGKTESEIYVGGTFTQYRGKLVYRLIRTDAQGVLDSTYIPQLSGNVNAMVFNPLDSSLLIGGSFSTIGTTATKKIARLLSNGSVDSSFLGAAKAFDSDVNALAVTADGKIWAGGKFTTYNTNTQKFLARLLSNGNLDSSFTLQGAGFSPLSSVVLTILAMPDGGAIVGGSFTSYGSSSANRIVKIAADGSVDMTFAIGTGFNGTVRTLKLIDGLLYVGGDFTSYQGVSANRLVRLKLDGKIDPGFAIGVGLNGAVYSLGFDSRSGILYAGGSFTTAQSINVPRIAGFKLTGERDLSLTPTFGFNATVTALLPGANGILATGAFVSFENMLCEFIARISFYGRLN